MTFDRAWRAFMDEDADHRAPSGLEARVQQAIAGRQPRRRRRSSAGLALAASLGIAAAWWFATSTSAPTSARTILQADASRPFASYAASVVSEQPDFSTTRSPATRAPTVIRRAPQLGAPDAGGPQETFQLVRLRLPRQALATLGFLMADPDGSGMVDVDVLVGEDGLARHIARSGLSPSDTALFEP